MYFHKYIVGYFVEVLMHERNRFAGLVKNPRYDIFTHSF